MKSKIEKHLIRYEKYRNELRRCIEQEQMEDNTRYSMRGELSVILGVIHDLKEVLKYRE